MLRIILPVVLILASFHDGSLVAEWSEPVIISQGSGNIPGIALDSEEDLHVVWDDYSEVYYTK